MLAPEMPSPEKQQTESNFPSAAAKFRRRTAAWSLAVAADAARVEPDNFPRTSPPPGAAALPERKIATASSAISQAIEEVTQIVESLKQTLEQMEEVLELVELAERQKSADEREIESLRHALRKIQQPRSRQQERP